MSTHTEVHYTNTVSPPDVFNLHYHRSPLPTKTALDVLLARLLRARERVQTLTVHVHLVVHACTQGLCVGIRGCSGSRCNVPVLRDVQSRVPGTHRVPLNPQILLSSQRHLCHLLQNHAPPPYIRFGFVSDVVILVVILVVYFSKNQNDVCVVGSI